MKTILVDDEPFSLEYLQELCMQLPELEIVACFEEASSAISYLKQNTVGLVLTDIEMPGMTGLEAVKEFRRYSPEVGVIFITGYGDYALEAFHLEAVAYLIKPCGLEELRRAVARAGKLMLPEEKRVELRTFGLFATLIDGEPYRFANQKAKELLALLVDRNGADVTMEQAVDVLWGERAYDVQVKRLYRKAVAYLHQIMKEKHLDFFLSNRGSCHIIPSKIECDYFSLLRGEPKAVSSYSGEYMSQYSWAEATIGRIERMIERTLETIGK